MSKPHQKPLAHPRSGQYLKQPTGYWAYSPVELPPVPEIDLQALQPKLSAADQALGRLDGIARIVPNPKLFVSMYVRKEAVQSSQIEGTQASLSDILDDEGGRNLESKKADVREIQNYMAALNHGIERLGDLPVSLRLIREIHGRLMHGVRGGERNPGEFRATQNWIGPEGCMIDDAVFVPPSLTSLLQHLSNLEEYIRSEDSTPILIRAGIAHAQFETIHPFLDGNGRMGRVLISLLLHERHALIQPVLYLSDFFSRHKTAYYEHLMVVREKGDWEVWLKFFLTGVEEVAKRAVETAHAILQLQERHRAVILSHFSNKPNLLRLLEAIYQQPSLTAKKASELIDVSVPTAHSLVADLESIGFLVEVTGRERNRVFRYQEYVDLLSA